MNQSHKILIGYIKWIFSSQVFFTDQVKLIFCKDWVWVGFVKVICMFIPEVLQWPQGLKALSRLVQEVKSSALPREGSRMFFLVERGVSSGLTGSWCSGKVLDLSVADFPLQWKLLFKNDSRRQAWQHRLFIQRQHHVAHLQGLGASCSPSCWTHSKCPQLVVSEWWFSH